MLPTPPSPTRRGPLSGVRVLDLTQVLAGPYGSLLLADMGAEVIKIERPPQGDPARQITPFVEGESVYFWSVNRNKRSVLLDLTQEAGRNVFLDLVRETDVLLDNFRPGVMARLGLDFPRLAEINPRLIACSISAFGQDGPYRDRPAFDLVIQAMSGLMSITGEAGRPPMRMGLPMGDLGGGLFAVIGILAALHERAQTGRGQKLDLSLLDGLVGMQTYLASTYLATGEEPEPVGSGHHNIVPYQAFEAADGWLVVAIFTDAFWGKLCQAMGLDALGDDPGYRRSAQRTAQRDTLLPLLEARFREEPRDEWLRRLEAADVPCAPVYSLGETLADPQVQHRGMTLTLDHPTAGEVGVAGPPLTFASSAGEHRAPPLLGQHTREVLREIAGYSADQIERLAREGVIPPDAER